MRTRKALSFVFGVAVSGGFLWLILRSLPFEDFLEAIKRADLFWIAAGLGFFVLGYVCRIWRWRLMLVSYNAELTWKRCSVPFMVSISANNVLPFRVGDVLRGIAFTKWLGVPTAHVLATLLVERLLDLLSLIVALAVAMSLFSASGAGLRSLFGWNMWAFFLIACVVGLVLVFPRVFEPLISLLIRALPGRDGGLAQKIATQAEHVFQTLAALAQRARMVTLMFWSFLAWFFEACVFFSVARAIPDITAPVAAWVAMPVGTLSTMLPSTPGYIGTFHYFVIQAAELLGNPAAAAAAFAFLTHLLLFVPATLWGGACFVYWSFEQRKAVAPIDEVKSIQ